ncbi:very short patch repair endonuclease [Geomobilimonas luticola]|uniref:Very short patch repair endonuclease n=1 Tax=Geomobilimonas luticola TaxID=1114878 RepID=A0ABS5S9A8_9BACT|nr:DNA mismatch endonuclease Vsr [Geomobilimonas luticola]MBT0651952.1 DNA mismatch endonuclease Vsr [Geomobilimonas luticola]
MDTLSSSRRSWNMSRIRGRDTAPELRVRSALHRAGLRFRLHRRDLPGTPDIVLPRFKTVIFVHGCFWHRHEGCKYAYMPKSRIEFWVEKFSKNVERDRRKILQLQQAGWNVEIIWECETTDTVTLSRRLDFLPVSAGEDTK